MKTLRTPQEAVEWLRERGATDLACDSRKVGAGEGFIAWPGAATDGRKFVPAALQQGAKACLVEAADSDAFDFSGDAVAAYEGLKAATGPIAALFYGEPSKQIAVLAITGTNGKTSTAWWLAQALTKVGMPCGLVGTLGVGVPPHVESTGLTTPDPVLLQRQFRRFADQGLKACAIEASSVGIVERRMDGTQVRVAAFTNFTQDHLDYHGSMEAYWEAKAELFRWPGLQAAVVNVDDDKGVPLQRQLEKTGLDLRTYSTRRRADLWGREIGYGAGGLRFEIVEGQQRVWLATGLVGEYNVSNLLCVIGMMEALGVRLHDAVQACADLLPVPGRMERLSVPGKPLVAVDYAHTPDALAKALEALRPLAAQRSGRLWCVFGCGGDRDPTKRPLMAAAAESAADRVVVTSDNPRSEQPQAIIEQILQGIANRQGVQVEPDRARAIAQAIAAAAPQDVVLLAGKGHEDYQEVAGVKHPFADQAHAQAALDAREADVSMFPLHVAAGWLKGRLVGDGNTIVQRVHTDTRTLQPGDLFVALKGERFDANDFIADARAKGAVAAIAHPGKLPAGMPGIEVDDSKLALGALAAAWRAQFDLPLIAVTGSNGKTTVTQMIASILRAWQGEASLATQGNLNNDIGVPMTLLRLHAGHRVAVVELGMNHPGEIGYLANIVRPTVGLVNNSQREHQEFMATVQAVAEENGKVFGALPAGGTAVYPVEEEAWRGLWQRHAGTPHFTSFGELGPDGQRADYFLAGSAWQQGHWTAWAITPQGPMDFRLHIAGRHNLRNAMAAAACTLSAGVPMEAVIRGLEAFEAVKGRSRALGATIAGRAISLVDDTYNANPDSVRAAIDVLAELPGPRLLVLGDMGEVGDQGPAFHAEVGDYARERGIEQLFTLGEQAVAMRGTHFADIESLQQAVRAALPGTASVLVKGSRFMKMERVVEAIQQQEKESGDAR